MHIGTSHLPLFRCYTVTRCIFENGLSPLNAEKPSAESIDHLFGGIWQPTSQHGGQMFFFLRLAGTGYLGWFLSLGNHFFKCLGGWDSHLLRNKTFQQHPSGLNDPFDYNLFWAPANSCQPKLTGSHSGGTDAKQETLLKRVESPVESQVVRPLRWNANTKAERSFMRMSRLTNPSGLKSGLPFSSHPETIFESHCLQFTSPGKLFPLEHPLLRIITPNEEWQGVGDEMSELGWQMWPQG